MVEDIELAGKRILQVSASAPEKTFLEAQGPVELVSLDVRPKVKADIRADLCAMPGVDSERFDVVFASYVLPYLHDLDGALSEIWRVLTPAGVYISCEIPSAHPSHRSISDTDEISQWYGADAYERYKVGRFRILGSRDLLRSLQTFFLVKSFPVRDVATGQKVASYLCFKDADWGTNGRSGRS